ncbi:MAG: isocitrate lyase/PEP mutase family protein [Acidobacteria bacterium]|nr:isocitrate lyase/PEP mutase family protein [Acidobacteriota bacterium]
MDNDQTSRRNFVQQTAAVAAGALALGITPASAASSTQTADAAASRLSKPQKLRALLRRPGLLHAPEAYNVLAAQLAEYHGFEAIYIGGNMMSGTYLGLPDWGMISNTEMIEIAGRIARGVSIPAIVDADEAGETPLNVYRNVQQYEKAGIAGLHIEDTLLPKLPRAERQKLTPGDPIGVSSIDRMVLRIRAALDARSDPDFIIIARTVEQDIDAVVRRGKAYADAGADVFMNGLSGFSAEQIDRIGREVPIPLLGIGVPLANRGTQLKVNIYANLVSGPASALCDTILRELKEHGEAARRPSLDANLTSQLKKEALLEQIAVKWASTR